MERVDRDDPFYKVCRGAFVAGGAVAGNIVGGFSAPVTGGLSLATLPWGGIAMGFAAGYLACPYLVPMLRPKIEKNLPLDDFAINQAVRAMSQYANVHSSSDATKLLAIVRSVPNAQENTTPCTSPTMAAKTLLSKLNTT